jgi:LysR family transcriptional regulator, hydrogen peroxide-inducible genes activator
MTITQLEYIIAVDQTRNFGRAARACAVTQPTLSMQIQKLEGDLGVQIFDRSKTPVIPTVPGKAIIDQARMILQEVKKLSQLANQEKGEVGGSLSIGVIPTLAPYLLPLFVDKLVRKYPQLELQIEELQTVEMVSRLKEGSLDVGILVTPLSQKTLLEIPVFYEPFFVYFSPEHPLLKRKKIRNSDLSIDEVWLLSEGHCFRDQALELCQKLNQGSETFRRLRFESGNLETLRKLVDRNFGYTLLPFLAAEEIRESKKKARIRAFTAPVPTREVSLVCGRAFPRPRVLDAVIKEVKAALPPELRAENRSLKAEQVIGLRPLD